MPTTSASAAPYVGAMMAIWCKGKRRKDCLLRRGGGVLTAKDLAAMLWVGPGAKMAEAVDEAKGERLKSKQVGPDKWKLGKQVGRWRTTMGKRRFYPADGSPPTPPYPKGVGMKGGAGEKVGGKDVSAMLQKVEKMMLQAQTNKDRGALAVLKQMQSALKARDEDAFRKASAKLAKVVRKRERSR